MTNTDRPARTNTTLTLLAAGVIIAALYFARSVLVPLALAVLLSFLLAPLVTRLERLKLGRVVSVLVVVTICFALLTGVGWLVWGQVSDLADKLPEYRDNIHAKVMTLRSASGGKLGQTTTMLREIGKELSAPPTQPTTQATQPANPADAATEAVKAIPAVSTTNPVQVEVVDKPPTPVQFLQNTLGPLLDPLGTAGLVIIFVIFILIQREDLRDRMIRLISNGQWTVTTQALDDAATRVSRYLLMQLVVNVTYGIPIGVGLYFIGVPNALLWGLLATVLRFIPYIGPWIAAGMPILLALAVSSGWSMPIYTVMLFVVVELISNNAVEPLLYGSSTGISSVAVLVAAVFWTWLWGIPGLLLSTPMTVLLAVTGKYVPQLGFLNVLLGDEPVLDPHVRVYQRLLAGDPEEAQELVEEILKEKDSLLAVYDQVLMPALALAEMDRHNGRLDEQRQKWVHEGIQEIVEEMEDRYALPDTRLDTPAESAAQTNGDACCVLCLPAHDRADELVSLMLAQALELSKCRARVVPVANLASQMVEAVDRYRSRIVCVSALPPSAITHARYLCKRLRARLGGLTVITGIWNIRGDLSRIKDRLRCSEKDQVARSLIEAVEQITPLVQAMSTPSAMAAARP